MCYNFSVFAGGFVGVHESGTINRSYSNINFSDIAVIVKAHILQQNSRAHANVNIGGFIGELYTNANITNSFSAGNINARLIAEEILANGTRPANFEKLTLYGFSLETEFISNVYVSENQTLTVDQAINSFILNAHSINETTLKSHNWQLEHLFNNESLYWTLLEGYYPTYNWNHKNK